MTLGTALLRRGIRAEVVEINPAWSVLGIGISVQGATLRALHGSEARDRGGHTMKCSSCGAAVHPSADFCRVCGADAPKPSAETAPRLRGMDALRAIRIPGAITREKLDILRQADAIYLDEIRKAGLYDHIWQAFAVLLPVRTVGVMGDGRTYEFPVALRAVTSSDGMTADWFRFPSEFLAIVSSRIVNEVKGVNRVVYDISSKPPATIEWE